MSSYFEERRIDVKIFRNNVETEEMAIDAFATHGVLVAQLVLLAGCSQQLDSFRILFQEQNGIHSLPITQAMIK